MFISTFDTRSDPRARIKEPMTEVTETAQSPSPQKKTGPTVRAGMETPWGMAQEANELAPDGIGWVTTASHGGLKLSVARNNEMPDYLRIDHGWYEEDCAWVKAAVFFEEILLASGDPDIRRQILSGNHRQTFRDWYPREYEKFYGVELKRGESYVKDERLFFEEHASELICVSAYGEWHTRVPKGMVGVIARVGGNGAKGQNPAPGPARYFLVPKEEYETNNRFGFVIEPARHEEIEKFD